uniref:hypothetical protein n=1 Tax=Candidatus Electronema sp. TaxID=2698783 RepID=UPI004055B93D
MQSDMVNLVLEGIPDAEVKVLYRSRSDEIPPPVYEGKIGADGFLKIIVPRAYLVVIGCHQTIPLELHLEEAVSSKVVQLNAK